MFTHFGPLFHPQPSLVWSLMYLCYVLILCRWTTYVDEVLYCFCRWPRCVVVLEHRVTPNIFRWTTWTVAWISTATQHQSFPDDDAALLPPNDAANVHRLWMKYVFKHFTDLLPLRHCQAMHFTSSWILHVMVAFFNFFFSRHILFISSLVCYLLFLCSRLHSHFIIPFNVEPVLKNGLFFKCNLFSYLF